MIVYHLCVVFLKYSIKILQQYVSISPLQATVLLLYI